MFKKPLIAIAAVVGVLGCAQAAYAGTAMKYFDAEVPSMQQSHYLAYQTKTTSNKAASLAIDDIGSKGQKMNAKVENSALAASAESKGLTPSDSAYSIAAKFSAGTSVRMVLTNYQWNLSTVEVDGYWASN